MIKGTTVVDGATNLSWFETPECPEVCKTSASRQCPSNPILKNRGMDERKKIRDHS
jgi:hypothetical protein